MTRCGTPTYVSPEILKNHPHDESTDMWSIGVILYLLLVGYPPFREVHHRDLFKKIRFGEYSFYPDDWRDISEGAKDIIQKLLVVDPFCLRIDLIAIVKLHPDIYRLLLLGVTDKIFHIGVGIAPLFHHLRKVQFIANLREEG